MNGMPPVTGALGGWLLATLGVAGVVGCFDGAARVSGDGATDATASHDIARVDATNDTTDLGVDDRFDAGGVGSDLGHDLGVDANVFDAGMDAGPDVPGVRIAGYFIPVDPNAVPPPGSECMGTDGGVRAGDPSIAPPRPVRPLSVSRVTSQRPTFQWVLPEGTTGARVELCADRCCTRVLQTFDAEGTSARPVAMLPPGVVFWRMFGRRGTTVGSRASYTWEFGVRRRDAPNDTSWGTIRDFNGDGYDDLVVLAHQNPGESDRTSEAMLVPGSERGLQPPLRTGFVLPRLPRQQATVGDFNGDGLADATWISFLQKLWSDPRRIDVMYGDRSGLRTEFSLGVRMIDECAGVTRPGAMDWDGDGYSDIVATVLMRCESAERPRAVFLFVYRGSSRGVAPVPQIVVRMDESFAHPSAIVRSVLGDLDLDGYGDAFLISEHLGSGTSSAPTQYTIVHGTPAGTPRYERIERPVVFDVPSLVRPVGDLDGDGHLDWSWYFDRGGFHVYRHARTGGMPSELLIDNASRYGAETLGFSSAGADMNGDGLCDLVASATEAFDEVRDGRPFEPGRVYVYPGMPGGLATRPTIVVRPLPGSVVGVSFGRLAMSPGDINGDGLDDMVMATALGRGVCFYYGRTAAPGTQPDGCTPTWWPSYEVYL